MRQDALVVDHRKRAAPQPGLGGALIGLFRRKYKVVEAVADVSFTIEPGDRGNPDFESPDLAVKFTGPDIELLLSNRAELLLALELEEVQ